MLLSDFAANAEVKHALAEGMKNRSIPHALLIEGDKGCGKQTLARIIAQYAVCTAEGERPCGVCSQCRKAAAQVHPDIFTADGSRSGELNIEAVRGIRSAAYIRPNEAENRVFILLNCDKMLAPAQNAFLKVLEEPPENVLFILTVVSAQSLLQTVRSRTRIISLYPPAPEEALPVLQRLLPDQSEDVLLQAARDSGGNIGAALELLQSGGEEEQKAAEEIFRVLPQSTEYQLLVLTNRITRSRPFAAAVLDKLCELSAEAVKASLGMEVPSSAAKEAAQRLSFRRLMMLQENIRRARDVLNTNVNLNFYGTWLCAVLRNNETGN